MQLDDEMKALVKCNKLIDKLDDEAKLRVMKYLVEKFGRGLQKAYNDQVQNQGFQKTNDVKQIKDIALETTTETEYEEVVDTSYPSMRDIVIKDYPKNEPEWVLIYSFYSSSFGKGEFTREGVLNCYDESKRAKNTRKGNLTNNLNKGINKDWYKSLNDKEFIMLEKGVKYAKEILVGKSTGSTRKKGRTKSNSQE